MIRLICIVFFVFPTCIAYTQNPLVKQWDHRFGGTKSDEINSFQQTRDGGYILGGSSKSAINGDKSKLNWDTIGNTYDYWIVKINAFGIKEWDNTYGGTATDVLTCIQQTNDNGYIIGGWSFSGNNGDKTQPTKGLRDYWIVKIDSSGNKMWDKTYGGTDDDYLYSFDQTIDGGYIIGRYSSLILLMKIVVKENLIGVFHLLNIMMLNYIPTLLQLTLIV